MLTRSLCVAAALCMAGAAEAQTGPTGRYGAVMEYDPALTPAQTVYRPRDLGQLSKIPIVAWGNGGCQPNGGSGARPFLMQVASEGFLIIAAAKPGPDPEPQAAGAAPLGPPAPAVSPRPPPPSGGPTPTTSADMIAAIDWAIRENSRPGSIYKGRLDTHAIAVMGHSCGGLQALEAAFDPRVATAVIWSSGVLNTGGPLRGTTVTKDDLKKLHTPVAYIQGGPTDVAYPNALDDYGRINGVPLFMGELNVGHGGTFRQPNGGAYSTVGTAWLNWRLKGDKAAGAMFRGVDCGLCTDPAWKVSRKGIK